MRLRPLTSRPIVLLALVVLVTLCSCASLAVAADSDPPPASDPATSEQQASGAPAASDGQGGDTSGDQGTGTSGDQGTGDQGPDTAGDQGGGGGSSDTQGGDGTGSTDTQGSDGTGSTDTQGSDGTGSSDEPVVPPPAPREQRIPGRYIVVYKNSVSDPGAQTKKREREKGFKSRRRFKKALKGFVADLSKDQVRGLEADPEVAFVTPDRKIEATDTTPLAAGEPLPPTGVRRIQAASSTAVHPASGVNVAVIDTGIALDHPDLNATSGTDCIDPGTDAQDENGHGTHVAGTIAAANNGSGVVGVAPGTKLYAVRVLDPNGNGTLSSEICGIDWVTANAAALNIKVANMSLGGGGSPVSSCATTTDAEHKAICNSTAAGVTYVVAAGNDSQDFDYAPSPDTPAAFPEVLTVTAESDSDGSPGASGGAPSCFSGQADDRYATFSNYAATSAGQAHTIAAPGVCIHSTWLNGGYNTISGTSMATPHLTGAVALCLDEGGVGGPCAGMTPAQIVQKMRSDAQAHTTATPGYGFTGDPSHPVSGKYFGYLDWVGLTQRGSDTTAPTVSSFSPADAAIGVQPGTNVSVTFSEAMDHASTQSAFSLVKAGDATPVSGTFSWSGNTMTFDPTDALAQGARYTATVTTAAQDLAANRLAQQAQSSFTSTDLADGTGIYTGTARATSATTPPRLDADDNVFFQVNSTTSGRKRSSAWYARFLGVPTGLSRLTVGYRGANSQSCGQTISLLDWTANSGAGAWVTLDSRSVGPIETPVSRSPSGALARFVAPGTGEVRVVVFCSVKKRSFFSSGDVLQLAYAAP